MINVLRALAALTLMLLALPPTALAQIDTTARGIASQAKATAATAQSTATAAQSTAALPATVTIYAKAYGVVADGATANDTPLANAITAAATAASTYANAQFYEVVLPAGQIRITQPLVVMQPMTNVGFRLRGAGRNGTVILADFASTQ
ncbi:MAG: glycosyl hydrolase family 28-related protein, partial [Methylovirgula sp.]|nr:glycosyl hydrolase family 28-related protein [Methylovirgula sp.]